MATETATHPGAASSTGARSSTGTSTSAASVFAAFLGDVFFFDEVVVDEVVVDKVIIGIGTPSGSARAGASTWAGTATVAAFDATPFSFAGNDVAIASLSIKLSQKEATIMSTFVLSIINNPL